MEPPGGGFHHVGFFLLHLAFASMRAGEMSLRITVADDEALMREFYQDVLPPMGHKLLAVAQSGSALLECCRKERPGLVITDIKMPEMDGIEAASAIWREMSVPVIVVSAYTDAELISRAQDKPVMA